MAFMALPPECIRFRDRQAVGFLTRPSARLVK
jgi:hypothetical protein